MPGFYKDNNLTWLDAPMDGQCPTAEDAVIQCVYKNNSLSNIATAICFNWTQEGSPYDIKSYTVLKGQ